MKRVATPAVLLGLCTALVLSATPTLRAETPNPAPQESLEKQIETLRGAFCEALQSRDWKMLELAAAGFMAAGLKGKDLELEMLHAERDAALGVGGGGMNAFGGGYVSRPQVITWGLTCRAKAGDASALETLRQLGKMDPQTIKAPDQKIWREDPATAKAAQKAYQEYLGAIEDRNQALLCLAMLKEPGVLPRALECLTAKVEKQQNAVYYMGGFGGGSNALVEATVAADPQEGLKKLVEILNQEGEAVSFETKVTILQGLFALSGKNQVWGIAQPAFTIDTDIGALLPKDTAAQLVKPYTVLLKSWKPKEGAAFDNSMNSLVSLAYYLPKDAVDADLLAALEAIKGKIAGDPNAQYFKQVIDQALAQHKPKTAEVNKSGAAKPPKAPEDF
ncbi:MAG: hypothetical protein HY291_04575 [Planctomycetes bacterium]|nr:hypothetical protein [Planctomycetota bacterium]